MQLTMPDRLGAAPAVRRPRLAFVGLGWIGRHRMEAIRAAGVAEIVAVADPAHGARTEAATQVPEARACGSLQDVLALKPDGVVIATPSAQHAAETIEALEAGCAVFCQKPLGRTAGEVQQVVDAARKADRLLGVDLSYRRTAGMQAIEPLVRDGALGSVFAVDVTFHNAYGPDKPWFYDRTLSGGGCLMDLGVHLLDMALRPLGYPEVASVEAHLRTQGRPAQATDVEDFALATLRLTDGTVVRLGCSWKLHAGCDAVIACDFYGTEGGATLRNRDGSFYDFTACRTSGNQSMVLSLPPDDWGGRMAADWAACLAASPRFDPACAELVTLHGVLDRIYAAARQV